jgi:hypothetical protein
MSKIDMFKTELKSLLEKFDASISYDVNESEMIVCFGKGDDREDHIIISNSTGFDCEDLENN